MPVQTGDIELATAADLLNAKEELTGLIDKTSEINVERTVTGLVTKLTNYLVDSNIRYTVDSTTTKLYSYGKNLINPLAFTGPGIAINVNNNSFTAYNSLGYTSAATLPIFLAKGTYKLSATETTDISVRNTSDTYLFGFTAGSNKSTTVTISTSGIYNIKFTVQAGVTKSFTDLMLEVGDTKTDYTNFTSKTEYNAGDSVTANDTIMTDGATCTITYKTNETAPAKFDNPLYGKIALFDGDSFCAAGTADGKGWAYLIGEANAMSYTNYGVAGATVADITGQEGHSGAHCICKSIDTMAAEADYIVLEGGVNDYLLFSQYGFPLLGAVSTGYAATLDETTFCGAMESLCKKALTKYVGKKILFIIAHKTTGSVNATAQDWFNKQREILEKWNIPYVDLYKTAGICVQLSAQNSLFHDEGGGTYWGHLTASGYIAVTPKIESKMKSI